MFSMGADKCSNVRSGSGGGGCTLRVEHKEDVCFLSCISARGFILRGHHGHRAMCRRTRFLGVRRDAAMWRGG